MIGTTTTTTENGLDFSHTVVLDDWSVIKFFAGIVFSVLVIILLHKLIATK